MCANLHRKPAPKSRAASGHGLGVAKDDPCLISRGCQRIHLDTAFTVGSQHVKGHSRRQGRLGVAPGHLDIRAPKAPRAIGFDPSEKGVWWMPRQQEATSCRAECLAPPYPSQAAGESVSDAPALCSLFRGKPCTDRAGWPVHVRRLSTLGGCGLPLSRLPRRTSTAVLRGAPAAAPAYNHCHTPRSPVFLAKAPAYVRHTFRLQPHTLRNQVRRRVYVVLSA